jgi:hypothetical protein
MTLLIPNHDKPGRELNGGGNQRIYGVRVRVCDAALRALLPSVTSEPAALAAAA